jgi:2-polyprenyl-6-methoxyphenol hydroxylase-like FAD-dependent oxidoreductase
MTRKVDVIISGAGPVGLLLAYDLSKMGHSVAIVDTKPGPTDQSRALLVTARTMEILDAKGLASDVLREAFISSGMYMHRNGAVVKKKKNTHTHKNLSLILFRLDNWMLVETQHFHT